MRNQDLTELINDLKHEFGAYYKVAEHLGIHYSHIYNYIARARPASPTLLCALKEQGYIEDRKRIRSQITWESETQKNLFVDWIETLGYASITDYCRDRANSWGSIIPLATVSFEEE